MKKKSLYPVFLRLEGRRVLVVGGGPVAARKARGLARAGARVTAVAPRFEPGFPAGVRRIKRRFRKGDCRGCALVFAAASDPAANRAAAGAASACGALVNMAADPESGDFHVPAVVRRGMFALALSTSGLVPAVARRLRISLEREIGRMTGPRFPAFLEWAAKKRKSLVSGRTGASDRKRRLRALADPAVWKSFRTGGARAAERKFKQVLK